MLLPMANEKNNQKIHSMDICTLLSAAPLFCRASFLPRLLPVSDHCTLGCCLRLFLELCQAGMRTIPLFCLPSLFPIIMFHIIILPFLLLMVQKCCTQLWFCNICFVLTHVHCSTVGVYWSFGLYIQQGTSPNSKVHYTVLENLKGTLLLARESSSIASSSIYFNWFLILDDRRE